MAACRGKTDKMFPNGFNDKTYTAEARKICEACPVRQQCLDYALSFYPTEMHGVWAGFTPNQLAREQRKRGIAPTKSTYVEILGAYQRKPGPGRPKKDIG